MSLPSPDAKAVVRAAEALTTQVRRIADALSTPVVRYEVDADDAPTTDDDACRTVEVDGDTVLIRGSGDFTEQDAEFLTEIVRAATRKYEAEHGSTPPRIPPWCGRCGDDNPAAERNPRFRVVNGYACPDCHPDALKSADGCECGGTVPHPDCPVHSPPREADEDDDAVAPTCWHTEPGSPCDWDRCHQPERLAAGDPGTDPATTPPLGPQLRARAEEDALRTARRNSVRNLIDRLDRHGSGYDEEHALLRAHVENEFREADAARDETKRLGLMVDDYSTGARQLSETLRREKERADAAIERETVLEGEIETQQAAIERVRAALKVWSSTALPRSEAHQVLADVRHALDGTEQPTTEQPEPPAHNFAAYQAAIARVVLVLREAQEHREQTDPSERQDCVMCGADHLAEIRDAIKGKPTTTEGS